MTHTHIDEHYSDFTTILAGAATINEMVSMIADQQPDEWHTIQLNDGSCAIAIADTDDDEHIVYLLITDDHSSIIKKPNIDEAIALFDDICQQANARRMGARLPN